MATKAKTRGQCYDLMKIVFAKKVGKNIGDVNSNYIATTLLFKSL
jgi:hypothetical protein